MVCGFATFVVFFFFSATTNEFYSRSGRRYKIQGLSSLQKEKNDRRATGALEVQNVPSVSHFGKKTETAYQAEWKQETETYAGSGTSRHRQRAAIVAKTAAGANRKRPGD